MGRPKIEESLSNSQPNRPIGALQQKKPRKCYNSQPLVVDSKFSYLNPWVRENRKNPVLGSTGPVFRKLECIRKLLLRTSPRFFARSDPNHCRNVLWQVNINNYRKKVDISLIAMGQNVRKRGHVYKKIITLEQNEISSPNLIHM